MFPTLFASGLVLFGFAELLFLGHISIFSKDFCCSLVTGQCEWIILLPHAQHFWRSTCYLLSLSLLLFLYVPKVIYSINSEFSVFTDLPLCSTSST